MSIYDRLTSQPDMNSQLRQLQNDPKSFAQRAGYNIPDNLMGNPQAMVQHLVQSGQVGGPMLQRIMPMMQRLMGK